MAKKIVLTNEKMNSLKGFEDALDLLDEKVTIHEGKGGVTQDHGSDNYELYNFLESELVRLNVLDQFFTYKISNIEANSPTQHLIEIQTVKLQQAREELVTLLKNPQSSFMKRLEHLWNSSVAKIL